MRTINDSRTIDDTKRHPVEFAVSSVYFEATVGPIALTREALFRLGGPNGRFPRNKFIGTFGRRSMRRPTRELVDRSTRHLRPPLGLAAFTTRTRVAVAVVSEEAGRLATMVPVGAVNVSVSPSGLHRAHSDPHAVRG